MCNSNGNLPFVADVAKVVFLDREYPVKVLHYYPGKEVNRSNLHRDINCLIDEAIRMGSKRLTVAWIDVAAKRPYKPGEVLVLGKAFCKDCPEDSGSAIEGRLRAMDRLRTIVEFFGGDVVLRDKDD